MKQHGFSLVIAVVRGQQHITAGQLRGQRRIPFAPRAGLQTLPGARLHHHLQHPALHPPRGALCNTPPGQCIRSGGQPMIHMQRRNRPPQLLPHRAQRVQQAKRIHPAAERNPNRPALAPVRMGTEDAGEGGRKRGAGNHHRAAVSDAPEEYTEVLEKSHFPGSICTGSKPGRGWGKSQKSNSYAGFVGRRCCLLKKMLENCCFNVHKW